MIRAMHTPITMPIMGPVPSPLSSVLAPDEGVIGDVVVVVVVPKRNQNYCSKSAKRSNTISVVKTISIKSCAAFVPIEVL